MADQPVPVSTPEKALEVVQETHSSGIDVKLDATKDDGRIPVSVTQDIEDEAEESIVNEIIEQANSSSALDDSLFGSVQTKEETAALEENLDKDKVPADQETPPPLPESGRTTPERENNEEGKRNGNEPTETPAVSSANLEGTTAGDVKQDEVITEPVPSDAGNAPDVESETSQEEKIETPPDADEALQSEKTSACASAKGRN